VPIAQSGKRELYYESAGEGPPVLLVMGLGMTHDAWWRTVPVLARCFRVLTFDNRGVGRSEPTGLPYTVSAMAEDAVAVLDAAGEDRVHVYGLSLGGMVAQEVALRHADRVRTLVLGATTPGGLEAPVSPDGVALLTGAMGMRHEEAIRASVPSLYAEETRRRHAPRIEEDVARRAGEPPGLVSYSQQLAAASGHTTLDRLERISAPTLVVHGEEDAIVPAANAHLIADAIPAAELELRRSAGHLYVTDDPQADRLIRRFLLRHTPERRGVAAALARALGRHESRRRRGSGLAVMADRLAAWARGLRR
jgi:3-oxoadipate enol-lactonase